MITKEHRTVKLSEIIPYANNPRKNDQAVPVVEASIERFTYTTEIEVDESMVILAGHTRYKALRKMGVEECEVMIIRGMTNEEKVAYRLAHNKTGEVAEWDEELLVEELEAVGDIPMDTLGFQQKETPIEVQEDEYEPEPPEDPMSKVGDVYVLGDHVLVVGDATSREDLEKLLKAGGGGEIDMIMTDPPYNVAIVGGTDDKLTIQNDDMEISDFQSFLTRALENMYGCAKAGAPFYLWYASWYTREVMEACNNVGLNTKQILIWAKNVFSLCRQDYQWKHEPCLYGWKEGAAHYFTENRTLTTIIEEEAQDLEHMKKEDMRKLLEKILATDIPVDVIHENKPVRNAEHPTMKPLRLIGQLIQNSSKRGESVLDLFGGSGSTLMACEQLGRRCLTMELDPRYADVIIDRWESYTGQKAEKVSG
jgi:site-specific DNA-methyltransferase (adenine-specific)